METSSQDFVESFLLESTSHEHQNSQDNHPPIQAPLSTGLVQNERLTKKKLTLNASLGTHPQFNDFYKISNPFSNLITHNHIIIKFIIKVWFIS